MHDGKSASCQEHDECSKCSLQTQSSVKLKSHGVSSFSFLLRFCTFERQKPLSVASIEPTIPDLKHAKGARLFSQHTFYLWSVAILFHSARNLVSSFSFPNIFLDPPTTTCHIQIPEKYSAIFILFISSFTYGIPRQPRADSVKGFDVMIEVFLGIPEFSVTRKKIAKCL